MGLWADRLIAELDNLEHWPPPHHDEALVRVSRGIALRENHEPTLRSMAGWDTGRRSEQRFLVDPMPSRISSAFASLIYGRQPEFIAEAEADQDRLDFLVAENNFRSELQRSARTRSSEGEVWWRLLVNKTVADVPILEWHSRTSVYPLWRGWRLMAVAFVSRLSDTEDARWRHFEVHEVEVGTGRGRVENVLYREEVGRVEQAMDGRSEDAGEMSLGERVPLDRHEEVETLAEEWVHGLPAMLGGRMVNIEGADPTIGISDYFDIEDWLLELDVAASIGHANLELAGRLRALVPESSVDEDASAVDLGEQVYVAEAINRGLGEKGEGIGPFKVLQYEFNAEALIAWKREAERTALNRVGIDAQYAGIDPAEGRAESGIALRIRLIPSQAAADERAQDPDHQLPHIARLMQMLDALPPGDESNAPGTGGFGRPWQRAEELPGVDRGATLPEDRVEATERRATAVEARIMSRRTAVEEDHPDWSDDEVDAELKRIADEEKASASASASAFGGNMPSPGDEDDSPESDAGTEPPQAGGGEGGGEQA